MKVRTTPRQQLEARHFYGLLGLSEPTLPDEVVGSLVPFKLSSAEYQFMMEETDIAVDIDSAVEGAQLYFQEQFPNGNVYYKKSRFYKAGVLHSLKYQTVLERFGWQ